MDKVKEAIKEIVKKKKGLACLDCGKCTSICPISLLNEQYTPRLMVNKAAIGDVENLLKDELLWSCLSCKLCEERCESDVHYTALTCDIRREAYKIGEEGTCSHSGALQSLMRIMTSPEIKQDRLDWVPKNLKIAEEGEYVYFVGCLPYFDAFFKDLELNTIEIAKSVIKILNYFDIEPVLMLNERCCGHDLLWAGDVENFKKLALQNAEEIKKTGAKKIITACPECYNILKEEYPKYVDKFGVEVIHISEFIAERIPELNFKKARKTISSFQDPCRLGRFSDIYEEPRDIINAIEGVELREMLKNRKGAICCGTSGWLNCSSYSKKIQIARLKEAKDTGADLLITSCPKCQIHFKCTMKDENTPDDAKIKIQDLTVLVAKYLDSKKEKKGEEKKEKYRKKKK